MSKWYEKHCWAPSAMNLCTRVDGSSACFSIENYVTKQIYAHKTDILQFSQFKIDKWLLIQFAFLIEF